MFKDLREDNCDWSLANKEERRKDELGKRKMRALGHMKSPPK